MKSATTFQYDSTKSSNSLNYIAKYNFGTTSMFPMCIMIFLVLDASHCLVATNIEDCCIFCYHLWFTYVLLFSFFHWYETMHYLSIHRWWTCSLFQLNMLLPFNYFAILLFCFYLVLYKRRYLAHMVTNIFP
jgi:hypothetical protein